MAFIEYNDKYKVEIIDSKVRDEFGDKISTYRILSKESENNVQKYCMEQLDPSFIKSKKPHLFSPELIEFKNTTNLNNGMGDIYIYKIKHYNTA